MTLQYVIKCSICTTPPLYCERAEFVCRIRIESVSGSTICSTVHLQIPWLLSPSVVVVIVAVKHSHKCAPMNFTSEIKRKNISFFRLFFRVFMQFKFFNFFFFYSSRCHPRNTSCYYCQAHGAELWLHERAIINERINVSSSVPFK